MPTSLSPRTRNLAAGLIHRAWNWVAEVAVVSPDDALGKRFRSMGRASCLAFPQGAIFGERWIRIGTETLVGPNVALAAGLPGEDIDADADAIVTIGDRCNIGRGSSIVGRVGIDIGDDVTTGPNTYITDHNHDYANLAVPISRQWPVSAPVRIGAGSWIGTGAVVLPGADLGRNVAVAAGSVVRGVVADHCVVAGVPAKVIRRYDPSEGWCPPLPPRPAPPEAWPDH